MQHTHASPAAAHAHHHSLAPTDMVNMQQATTTGNAHAHTSGLVFSFSTDCGPLLFSWWHPDGIMDYFAALAMIFLLALGAERYSIYLRVRDQGLASHAEDPQKRPLWDAESGGTTGGVGNQAGGGQADSWIRFVSYVVSISLNLILMLLAMSMNFGIFVSIAFGLAIGRAGSGASAPAGLRNKGMEECH